VSYAFTLSADPGTYGEFVINIECSSSAPTKTPTSEPSTEPTRVPTIEPTTEPSLEPSSEPTKVLSKVPTLEPTQSPSTRMPTAVPTNIVSSALILPQNAIVIWSDCANIPDGWTLCDGSDGTPNLQGRFVVGGGTSSATFNFGDSGGATTHSHTISMNVSGSVGNTALTIDQMPRHNHADGSYNDLLKVDGRHTATDVNDETNGQPNLYGAGEMQYQGSGQSHGHTLELSYSASVSPTSHLPPWYALCYIMKMETQTWVVES